MFPAAGIQCICLGHAAQHVQTADTKVCYTRMEKGFRIQPIPVRRVSVSGEMYDVRISTVQQYHVLIQCWRTVARLVLTVTIIALPIAMEKLSSILKTPARNVAVSMERFSATSRTVQLSPVGTQYKAGVVRNVRTVCTRIDASEMGRPLLMLLMTVRDVSVEMEQ